MWGFIPQERFFKASRHSLAENSTSVKIEPFVGNGRKRVGIGSDRGH